MRHTSPCRLLCVHVCVKIVAHLQCCVPSCCFLCVLLFVFLPATSFSLAHWPSSSNRHAMPLPHFIVLMVLFAVLFWRGSLTKDLPSRRYKTVYCHCLFLFCFCFVFGACCVFAALFEGTHSSCVGFGCLDLFLRVMRFLVPGDIVLCVPPFLLLVVVV